MDLDSLRAFVTVVESGSFVSAANSLKWARATLRRRIDELEAELGVTLLARNEQGATPTAAGQVLAKGAQELLAHSSAVVAATREATTEPGGVLKVGLPVGLPPQLTATVVGLLRARRPELALEARFAERPLDLLRDEVDVVVCFEERPPDGPWVSRELARLPLRLLASRNYLERRGTPESLEQLSQHPLFYWSGRPGSRELPLLSGGGRPVRPTLASTDIHLLRECAASGLGILFAPDGGIPERRAAGDELLPVLPELVGGTVAARVVMPTALNNAPRIRAALEIVEFFLPNR